MSAFVTRGQARTGRSVCRRACLHLASPASLLFHTNRYCLLNLNEHALPNRLILRLQRLKQHLYLNRSISTVQLPLALSTLSDTVGRGSSVCIATRYGLDGMENKSWWGQDFPHPSRGTLRRTQPPVHVVPGLSRGKAVGVWRWPLTTLVPRLKEE